MGIFLNFSPTLLCYQTSVVPSLHIVQTQISILLHPILTLYPSIYKSIQSSTHPTIFNSIYLFIQNYLYMFLFLKLSCVLKETKIYVTNDSFSVSDIRQLK